MKNSKETGDFLKVTSGTARASPSLYSPGQSLSRAQPRYTGEEEKILSSWGEFVAIINPPHLVISSATPSLRPLTWRAQNNSAVIVASMGLFPCSLGWNGCPQNQDLTAPDCGCGKHLFCKRAPGSGGDGGIPTSTFRFLEPHILLLGTEGHTSWRVSAEFVSRRTGP